MGYYGNNTDRVDDRQELRILFIKESLIFLLRKYVVNLKDSQLDMKNDIPVETSILSFLSGSLIQRIKHFDLLEDPTPDPGSHYNNREACYSYPLTFDYGNNLFISIDREEVHPETHPTLNTPGYSLRVSYSDDMVDLLKTIESFFKRMVDVDPKAKDIIFNEIVRMERNDFKNKRLISLIDSLKPGITNNPRYDKILLTKNKNIFSGMTRHKPSVMSTRYVMNKKTMSEKAFDRWGNEAILSHDRLLHKRATVLCRVSRDREFVNRLEKFIGVKIKSNLKLDRVKANCSEYQIYKYLKYWRICSMLIYFYYLNENRFVALEDLGTALSPADLDELISIIEYINRNSQVQICYNLTPPVPDPDSNSDSDPEPELAPFHQSHQHYQPYQPEQSPNCEV